MPEKSHRLAVDDIFFNLATGRLELEPAKQPQRCKGIIGKVVSFDSFHKFGFLTVGDDRQGRVFFHLNNVVDKTLKAGDLVEFSLRNSVKYPGKTEAYDVRIVKEDS